MPIASWANLLDTPVLRCMCLNVCILLYSTLYYSNRGIPEVRIKAPAFSKTIAFSVFVRRYDAARRNSRRALQHRAARQLGKIRGDRKRVTRFDSHTLGLTPFPCVDKVTVVTFTVVLRPAFPSRRFAYVQPCSGDSKLSSSSARRSCFERSLAKTTAAFCLNTCIHKCSKISIFSATGVDAIRCD